VINVMAAISDLPDEAKLLFCQDLEKFIRRQKRMLSKGLRAETAAIHGRGPLRRLPLSHAFALMLPMAAASDAGDDKAPSAVNWVN
jgi:hypothetical protein